MENIKLISKLSCLVILLINIYFYFYVKFIKQKEKKFEKLNINLKSSYLSVILLKYLSILIGFLIILNYFTSISNFIVKIPLISSFFSLILLIAIIAQISGFYSSFTKIVNNNEIKLINYMPFKYKLSKLIIKYKYKISLAYIFLTYICLIYL